MTGKRIAGYGVRVFWRRSAGAGLVLAAAMLSGCATTGHAHAPATEAKAAPKPLPTGLDPWATPDPFPSTYRPLASRPTAIVGAHVLTAAGQDYPRATVVMSEGRILAVGPDVTAPAGATIVDGTGKWVTPGVIDPHSHLGVYASPEVPAQSDGNELTDPDTAQVWAEHSVWPQDPGFSRALAGGVTTLQILPGSGNLFGGRSVVLRPLISTTVQAMKLPGAPYGLKMACGENPKRVYGEKGRAPSTLMGNVAGYRTAWIAARDYLRKWDDYADKIKRGEKADAPVRNLQLDTLAGVLRGEILIQNHCYRSDEMAQMIDISHEFGFHIAAFHHAVESYKVAPLLAREHICTDTWATWGQFKMEAIDAIEENAALVDAAGACVSMHSDDANLIQHLNAEAGIAMAAGRRAGLPISEGHAVEWFTANPAKSLGIFKQTGSLELGKRADVVVWSADPFSVYAIADKVFIDGALAWDVHAAHPAPASDFELGRPGAGGVL